ncbi:MAG: peptidase dimerization domain-containing protein, partial [Candidatus Nanohaloarchaea archaeon]
KFVTEGKSSHSSRLEEGENAVLKMHKVISELEDFEKELGSYENEKLGKPTMAIGTIIKAGESVNTIPDHCEMTCDIRTIPEIHENIIDDLKEHLTQEVEISFFSDPTPPNISKEDSKIAEKAKKATGLPFSVAKGADDSGFYATHEIKKLYMNLMSTSNLKKSLRQYNYIRKLSKNLKNKASKLQWTK